MNRTFITIHKNNKKFMKGNKIILEFFENVLKKEIFEYSQKKFNKII